mmetsp:Transcript_4550/g.11489  ORF Transcript_4550/g.11489 Transcript_4550/m.11489 type:complete len:278 (-) Transcript_4550:164-997(-)
MGPTLQLPAGRPCFSRCSPSLFSSFCHSKYHFSKSSHLSHFWRDERQPERSKDVFLRVAADAVLRKRLPDDVPGQLAVAPPLPEAGAELVVSQLQRVGQIRRNAAIRFLLLVRVLLLLGQPRPHPPGRGRGLDRLHHPFGLAQPVPSHGAVELRRARAVQECEWLCSFVVDLDVSPPDLTTQGELANRHDHARLHVREALRGLVLVLPGGTGCEELQKHPCTVQTLEERFHCLGHVWILRENKNVHVVSAGLAPPVRARQVRLEPLSRGQALDDLVN